MVDWCETGSRRFVEPFFRETVERTLTQPSLSLFRRQTSIDELERVAKVNPGIAPSGFIFHASRCGSTLLAQMLAASRANRVLSEPGPVDEILATSFRSPSISEERRLSWLRALVSVLGRPVGDERRYFLKFDPWHVVALPLLRQAFPDVPWIFAFRDPLEILVSQSRGFGSQFVVGPLPPDLFGLDLLTAVTMSSTDYAAHVLGQLLNAAEMHLDEKGLLVEYSDLPQALDVVLDHLHVNVDETERSAMARCATFDAKLPEQLFRPDSDGKRAAAADAERAAAERLQPTYERLVAISRNRERRVLVP
jgi:hypothetical protein